MQGKQTRAISSNDDSRHPIHNFKAGDSCYALCFGPKQTKDRDGFQPWSSNQLALVLFKFEQFPKVASGDVILINFDHDFLQPKMMNQTRTTPLTLTNPKFWTNQSCTRIFHSRWTRIFSSRIYDHFTTFFHRFMALLIHDDRKEPESKGLSMVVLCNSLRVHFTCSSRCCVISFCIAH